MCYPDYTKSIIAVAVATLLVVSASASDQTGGGDQSELRKEIAKLEEQKAKLVAELETVKERLGKARDDLERLRLIDSRAAALATEAIPSDVSVTVVVKWDGAVLYRQPSLQSGDAYDLPLTAGQEVDVVGCNGDFIQINAGERSGWIYKSIQFRGSDEDLEGVRAITRPCADKAQQRKEAEETQRAAQERKEAKEAERRTQARREAEEAREKERIAQRRSRGSEPFLITDLRVIGPNSADGVGAAVSVMMLDLGRTLKYLTLTYTPYNGVGDPVASKYLSGLSTTKVKIAGPLNFQDGESTSGGDPIWYNPTIRCVKIERIDVEYMSGDSYTYFRELPKVLDPSILNDCSYQMRRP